LPPDDARWPGWDVLEGKQVLRCVGGAERADSVLAALDALPDEAGHDALVLVHDAARPCLVQADLNALIERAQVHPDGAILAAPVRDTLKRADASGCIAGTQSREGLWRALTPQAARRGVLAHALRAALEAGVQVTDEAMALERIGLHPALVEGREDNIKVTTPADLAVVEFLLQRRQAGDSE
jgi:2-C-methyl-D-erythritol 4-phosphate cytidylyltransferase